VKIATLRRVAPVQEPPDLRRWSYWLTRCRRHHVPYGRQYVTCSRKWREAAVMMVGGFPVRFRMFVADKVVVGCSNYHRERALKRDDLLIQIIQADRWTQRLCKEVADFTTDWLVLRDGRVVMVAGGPAHTRDGGAGSCCFRPGEVAGIAMEDRNGV